VLALLVLLSVPPESISPPPRGHFVRDLTGQINAATLAQLDATASSANASGSGQLGVCVVSTTGGVAPRTYATKLFNHWGVGHAGANDGLLLFVALDDHKAEIIIGDGLLDTRVTTAQTDGVMRDVVSHFKSHDTDGALTAGASELAALLEPSTGVSRPEPQAIAEDTPPLVADALKGNFADPSPRHWVIDLTGANAPHPELDRAGDAAYAQGQRRLFFLVTEDSRVSELARAVHPNLGVYPILVALNPDTGAVETVGIDTQHRAYARVSGDLSRAAQSQDWATVAQLGSTFVDWSVHGMPRRTADEVMHDVRQELGVMIFGGPIALLFIGLIAFRRWNRYRARTCECGRPRQLLSATAEKVHLSEVQQTEESLGSVDYDVWWCALCKNVWVNDNVAWFSRYSRCPGCAARTRSSSTTTISYASEYSTGLEQIDESCQNCSYRNTYTRVTARLTSSSSSSSSSSSDSFGGGSSSGGGSSGSW
jgi:uncharacterized membrane protein YgcG